MRLQRTDPRPPLDEALLPPFTAQIAGETRAHPAPARAGAWHRRLARPGLSTRTAAAAGAAWGRLKRCVAGALLAITLGAGPADGSTLSLEEPDPAPSLEVLRDTSDAPAEAPGDGRGPWQAPGVDSLAPVLWRGADTLDADSLALLGALGLDSSSLQREGVAPPVPEDRERVTAVLRMIERRRGGLSQELSPLITRLEREEPQLFRPPLDPAGLTLGSGSALPLGPLRLHERDPSDLRVGASLRLDWPDGQRASFLTKLGALGASCLLFSSFDYAFYNLSKHDPGTLRLYRMSQVSVQTAISTALGKSYGWKTAAAFNAVWWTFGCDLLYYGLAELLNPGGRWDSRGSFGAVLGGKVTWGWWTPLGLLLGASRERPLSGEALLIQAGIGAAVALLLISLD